MTTIFIFGDSIVWGAWDTEGGWVSRLRKEIDKRNLSDDDFYCTIYNLGVSGDTSSSLLKRFENEINTRLKIENEKPIIIVGIGENDSAWINSENQNKVPIQEFKENIKNIIIQAKKITKNIIFIGLSFNEESKTNPIPWNKNICYLNKHIKEYESHIKKICKEENISFVNIQDSFNEKTMLSKDGLHPNNAGHEEIYRKVMEKIANILN